MSFAFTRPAVVISANGSLVATAVKAADKLVADGHAVVVLNNAVANRPDVSIHAELLKKCGNKLVTVEDHQVLGGAGSMLVSALAAAGVHPQVRILGVQGEFGQSAYTADELYAKHGIGVDGIIAAVKALG
jgi:transketolase